MAGACFLPFRSATLLPSRPQVFNRSETTTSFFLAESMHRLGSPFLLRAAVDIHPRDVDFIALFYIIAVKFRSRDLQTASFHSIELSPAPDDRKESCAIDAVIALSLSQYNARPTSCVFPLRCRRRRPPADAFGSPHRGAAKSAGSRHGGRKGELSLSCMSVRVCCSCSGGAEPPPVLDLPLGCKQ